MPRGGRWGQTATLLWGHLPDRPHPSRGCDHCGRKWGGVLHAGPVTVSLSVISVDRGFEGPCVCFPGQKHPQQ